MRITIKSLSRADRFKCKFGIFNLLIRFENYAVRIKRGALNAIPHLKFYPRIKSDSEYLANIGDFCEFAETNILLGGEHPKRLIHSTFGSSYEILLTQHGSEFMPTSKGPIKIGPCCVFGVRTTVLSGVSIGHNSIIAAGSTLNGSYDENSVLAGLPARKIRKRLPDKQFVFLSKHPWWTASYDWIIKSIEDIQAERVPEIPFEPDPHVSKYLVIRLTLEDARIAGTALEGIEIDGDVIAKSRMPSRLLEYLDHFDGTGPVEIDTNILTKCF